MKQYSNVHKFRVKGVVQAVEYTGENTPEISELVNAKTVEVQDKILYIRTVSGYDIVVKVGDMVVQSGELFVACRRDVFLSTYEEI